MCNHWLTTYLLFLLYFQLLPWHATAVAGCQRMPGKLETVEAHQRLKSVNPTRPVLPSRDFTNEDPVSVTWNTDNCSGCCEVEWEGKSPCILAQTTTTMFRLLLWHNDDPGWWKIVGSGFWRSEAQFFYDHNTCTSRLFSLLLAISCCTGILCFRSGLPRPGYELEKQDFGSPDVRMHDIKRQLFFVKGRWVIIWRFERATHFWKTRVAKKNQTRNREL